MISIAATTGLLDAITAAGGNPDEILRGLGLNRSVFSNAEGFIPCSVFAGILKETARTTGDDCFGLHFGESFHPKNIGPLAYVALNSPTIAAGIENVERYLHVYDSSAKWFFTGEGSHGYIRYVLADLATPDGTYLNGTRVTRPTPLRSGDAIRVGSCTLRFRERRKRTQ